MSLRLKLDGVGSRDVAVGDILFESGPGFDDRFHAILFDDIVVIVQLKRP